MDPTSSQTGSPAATGDAALLHRIVARQADALSELYDRFSPTLMALARRILGSTADAEDVLQEVFVHVWNQAQKYDSTRSSVSTWLVLITRSRAIDRLRTRGVVERTHDAAGHQASVLSEGYTSPEALQNVFTQQRHERVRREMAALPTEQREVLEMAFYEGLSQTEIAAKAGLPLGTVKTRTLLAMRKLRSALREEIRQLL